MSRQHLGRWVVQVVSDLEFDVSRVQTVFEISVLGIIGATCIAILIGIFFPSKLSRARNAVTHNDEVTLENLLSKVDINSRVNPEHSWGGKGNSTLLHIAASNSKAQIVQLLMDNGANPCLKNESGCTPLNLAISRDSYLESNVDPVALEITEIFAKDGRSINESDEYGTPLHWCVLLGLFEKAGVLISHGADLNARNKYGDTPLHVGVVEKKWELVRLLLASGADQTVVDSKGMIASEYATDYDWKQEVIDYVQ